MTPPTPTTLAEVVEFDHALRLAIIQRDHDQVKSLLATVDTQNPALQEPLTSGFLEAAGRDAAVVKLFLDADFDVNACDEDGTTALMIASRGNDSYAFGLDIGENPIDGGAVPFVESLANVEQLLARGADVDAVDHTGTSALLQAVICSGVPAIVQALLDAKCNVVATDENEYMALHHAARLGHGDSLRLLLALHDPQDLNATTLDGESVLSLACQSGRVDVVAELLQHHHIDLDAPNNDLQTPLMMGVMVGSVDIVEALVKAGADVSKKDSIGMTALHHAACCGATQAIVECLVEAKSDVNSVDDMANSILHDVVMSSPLDVALYLLKSGADVSAVNEAGRTPTMLATEGGRQELVELLESFGGVPP